MCSQVLFLLIVCFASVDLQFLTEMLLWKQNKAPPCNPFNMFKVECNMCVCGADRIRSCTRINCSDVKQRSDEDELSDI